MTTYQIISFSITVLTWGFLIYYNRKWKRHKEECEQLLTAVEITQKETHKLQMHKFGWKHGTHPEIGKYVLLLLSDGAVVMGFYAGPHDGYRMHESFLFDEANNLRVHGWQYLPTGVPEFK